MDALLNLHNTDNNILKRNLLIYMQNTSAFKNSKKQELLLKLTDNDSERQSQELYKEIVILYIGKNVSITNDNIDMVKQVLKKCQTDTNRINTITMLDIDKIKELINKLYTNYTSNVVKFKEDSGTLYTKAINEIPQYFVNNGNPFLIGKYNNYHFDILIDSGATSSVLYLSFVKLLGLDKMIDTTNTTNMLTANGSSTTYGTLYHMNITICNENKDFEIPIMVDVIDDSREKNHDVRLSNAQSIILGMDFLKSYKAIINFNKNEITLNDKYTIKYKTKPIYSR